MRTHRGDDLHRVILAVALWVSNIRETEYVQP